MGGENITTSGSGATVLANNTDDMKTVLFNLHDQVLLCVLALCSLLAVLSATDYRFRPTSRRLLVGFFALNGMIAVDTLVFWGEGVKYAAFDLSPWLLTLFSFATFAFGPILYWFIRSDVVANPKLNWTLYLHLLPAVATPVYLYWVCYRYPIDVQRDLILNLGLYSVPAAHYATFIALKTLSPVVYGLMSLILLTRELLRRARMDFTVRYLMSLAAGYTLIRFWILTTHLCGLWLPTVSSDVMGLLGNYITLLFLAGLVWIHIRQPSAAVDDKAMASLRGESQAEIIDMSIQIQTFMDSEKPYLNPQLTLDRFAEQLHISPRQVSTVVNRCFQQNFQEYINRYRVEEAKRLLSNPCSSQSTIQEVARQAGFNSKATFNRFFKSLTSTSPSLYRQRLRSQL